ncbi:YggS family pyridoxal phosphate-dependent enzyme [Thiobacillus sp. 65-1402]|uniref:YggS family pyridoxal phosphate-dependent enzyme n=1 Tax=Thiobacillus sp. 65-1402 TaxID=1895861 RepID=UPI000968CE8E|nr:YggS family pyridoxal phosphate-dependent enzyme [Thiobacillus sp. 65-1402]OJW95300.1 MAG: YggS family pyridoxal phosphate enzyme [Thiobacillus sp. 65-1402]
MTAADSTPAERLHAVQARIAEAAAEAGRAPAAVCLLAVSKTFDAAAVRAMAACGQREFGENYLQEALEKQAALRDLPLIWHFIGPIQSNKTRAIAENFSWAHGIDRLKIAERLSAQRPPALPPLQVCIEVNVSGETSKGGVAPAELPALADAVSKLPGLRLRGLMAIPAPASDMGAQRAAFRQVREALDALIARGHALDTLSMGMSADLEAAIREGATIVRIGTALFGERTKSHA